MSRLLALQLLAAAVTAPTAVTAQTPRPFLDIPIAQHVNRFGDIRYAIWVTVGDRTVQALLDTGSTGLRVLPMVVPGDLAGVPSSVTFGAGIVLDGTALPLPIQIGSRAGTASVEVALRARCTSEKPDCDAAKALGDNFRIGNDGLAHQGYPGIVGIGFPVHGSAIDNPLQAVGVKRWIVSLPRPGEEARGHLILDPPDDVVATFTPLARHGAGDADACVKGGPLPAQTCGTVLLDSGAPALQVATEDATAVTAWKAGATGSLAFKTKDGRHLPFPFTVGESGGLLGAATVPPRDQETFGTFIMAGIAPYFAYDVLYDSTTRTIALRARTPAAPKRLTTTLSDPDFDEPLVPDRQRRRAYRRAEENGAGVPTLASD